MIISMQKIVEFQGMTGDSQLVTNVFDERVPALHNIFWLQYLKLVIWKKVKKDRAKKTEVHLLVAKKKDKSPPSYLLIKT